VPATLDLTTLERFVELALSALSAAREEIDALNVYPVPDGDTGTNMLLTVEAAHDAVREALSGELAEADRLPAALHGFARGALLGARGNSGVIFSQMAKAVCKRFAEAGPEEPTGRVLADALGRAAEASYAAVGDPVEGTILTVARTAAEAAQRAAKRSRGPRHVVRAAASAARKALARTPEQLPVLRAAGVVDAGGRALCVVLDALETTLTGSRPVTGHRSLGTHAIPVPVPTGDLTADGPGYEVMFLLEAEDERIPELRRRLAPLGDSLVVVGGDRLWNVHVHVDDVGAALEAGIEAGRPYRIRVTHFADQTGGRETAGRGRPRAGRQVVIVSAGPGLSRLYGEAGAVVVAGAPGRRPSTGELLETVGESGAAEVVLLPNDRATLPAAEAAASTARQELGMRVAVIPTTAQVQGLAALAVHEPGRSFEQDVLEMTAAARHARSGAVTVAVKHAMTSAGPCEPGQVLGVVEGDFVVVGAELFTVATEILERLLGGGGELVTLVSGDGSDLAERCAAYLSATHPTVDVVVHEGGQDRYPLLVGVE
jgi:DAK2 domain fusion protein YloV